VTLVVILSIVVVSALKILITCLPTPVVNWIVSKFETHSKIDLDAKVTIGGTEIKGETKKELINNFNKATFLKKYYVHPGNEHYFLHPQKGGKIVVINTKIGKSDVDVLVYKYEDHILVVKDYKKKLIAYSLLSEELLIVF